VRQRLYVDGDLMKSLLFSVVKSSGYITSLGFGLVSADLVGSYVGSSQILKCTNFSRSKPDAQKPLDIRPDPDLSLVCCCTV